MENIWMSETESLQKRFSSRAYFHDGTVYGLNLSSINPVTAILEYACAEEITDYWTNLVVIWCI